MPVSPVTSLGHTGRDEDSEKPPMGRLEILIPITLFICITYAIKALLDARTRAKLIAANSSEDLIRSLLLNEEQQRRQASLRWGVVLSCLAGGFALIEMFDWTDVTPGAIAVLLGATGIGNLAFFSIARNMPLQRP